MKHNKFYSLLQDTIITSEPLINAHLQMPPRGTVADRVAIYADGYYGRLEETLMSDYETLVEVMGESKFTKMCRLYTDTYPSYHYSLNSFGESLSQFLTDNSPYNKKPYLAEIADFEWAEYQAMVAKDAPLLTTAQLQSLPPELWPELQLNLHPSCKMLTLYWNSLAILKAARDNKVLPKAKKLKTPQSVFIWRRNLDVRYCAVGHLEFIMLDAIKNHATFIEICGKLSEQMPEDEVATYLVKELHEWLQEHVFSV